MKTFWCEYAWLPDGVHRNVLIDVTEGGEFREIESAETPPVNTYRLTGLVLPGFANTHSHAFHRALRGRTHSGGGTFWTWRNRMYELAATLNPDNYRRLATAVYAEMAVAGITCVGEFHYLHHPVTGGRYTNLNEMADALENAASAAAIRLSILDTCYLAGGINKPLAPQQHQFSDGTAEAWAERALALSDGPNVKAGMAIHSVRAVPRADLATVARASAGRPLHVHLSEQPAENDECLAAYGKTPTELLADSGVLSPNTTVVHATHVSTKDIQLLGDAGVGVCFCPTTEADLADGIGPARVLFDTGMPISLGTDQHAVIDPLVEARALEHGERLRTGQRGRISPTELLNALTVNGHAALGWPNAGAIKVGAPADLVAIRLDSARTAGCLPEQVIMAATAADVHTVVSRGEIVARDGVHEKLGDPGRLLAKEIEELWR